ncbi:hypothetical protein R1sor_010469 [Riccia sorocarpa]|uniref:Reverse transcriptase domain-containing protein n=1 Tax=Riccia sorocarpa TaxID=122646 RepID=A0ABD3HY43_9MARC
MEDRRKLTETLELVETTVSTDQNRMLIKPPDLEEVELLVKELKLEKAPGLDGMTAEALRGLGEEAEKDLLAMMLCFWVDGKLTWKQQQGVIKLIPKEGDLQAIKNWRPISLLNLGYKLIAKLLANRLKKVLPDLVSQQQKGFVSGRSITDNVMALQVGQEWARKSRQPTLFVKLDFEKAYDRVSHEYLWKTMNAMGFSQHFIMLTQGLVCGATSKIFVNGKFSKEIEIQRGVRQGCPLAPLLFSLATQPLILILQHYEKEEKIHGLQIKPNKSMLVQLFADDSGVTIRAQEEDFDELHNAIRLYERISGRSLIFKRAESFHGPKTTFRHGYYAKAAKMLTFQGRCIVLKHILRSIPVYNLACLEFTKKALAELEAIGRSFLWEINKEGQQKIPLIAWQALLARKNEGGLDMSTFEVLGRSLKMKQITKLFTNPTEEWVMAMVELLESAQTGNREIRSWEALEKFILTPPTKITNALTANSLLQTWRRARGRLHYKQEDTIPDNWSTEKYLMLAKFQGWIDDNCGRKLKRSLTGLRVRTLNEWKRKASLMLRVDLLDRETRECLTFGNRLPLSNELENNIEEMRWHWEPGATPYAGWSLPTGIWKCCFRGNEDSGALLNHKWSRRDSARRWKKRLSKIWKSDLPLRDKFWLWKVVQQGIPTAERVAKWGRGSEMCARCNQGEESVTRLFVSCPSAQLKWREWERRCHEPHWKLSTDGDLVSAIDSAWNGNHSHKIMLFVKTLWRIWLERNQKVFRGEEMTVPLGIAAKQAMEAIKALMIFTPTSAIRKDEQLRAIRQLTEKFHIELAIQRNGGDVEDDSQFPQPDETQLNSGHDLNQVLPH